MLLLGTLAAAPVTVQAASAVSSATTAAVVAAASSSPAVMVADFTARINADRVARGLAPLRSWPAVAQIAHNRAARMAALGTLSHAAGGPSISTTLTAAGLQWFGWGEIIGETTYPAGKAAVGFLYPAWKASPSHAPLMFSATYNYMGVAFVIGPGGRTWSSVVFVESVDHTAPVARRGALTRVGTAVTFSWSGADVRLQTHTAGLRGFDLQYRVDSGAWRTIRTNTTATSIRLTARAPGHTYGFRVRARDRRGNLSAWTVESRIRVP